MENIAMTVLSVKNEILLTAYLEVVIPGLKVACLLECTNKGKGRQRQPSTYLAIKK